MVLYSVFYITDCDWEEEKKVGFLLFDVVDNY